MRKAKRVLPGMQNSKMLVYDLAVFSWEDGAMRDFSYHIARLLLFVPAYCGRLWRWLAAYAAKTRYRAIHVTAGPGHQVA